MRVRIASDEDAACGRVQPVPRFQAAIWWPQAGGQPAGDPPVAGRRGVQVIADPGKMPVAGDRVEHDDSTVGVACGGDDGLVRSPGWA